MRAVRGLLLALLAGTVLSCDPPTPARSAVAPPPAALPPPVVRTVPLAPGPGTLRRLAGGAVDAYEIDLPRDQYLDAVFEQRGIDLVIDVYAPGHRRLFRIDSPNRTQGPEELRLVSETAGRYRFEVMASPGSAPGAYLPVLRAVRTPGDRDRTLAAADRPFYAAREIDRQPGRAWEAAAQYETAIRLFQEGDDRWHTAYAFFRLARVHHGTGRFREGLELATRAEGLFRALGDHHFVILSASRAGNCAQELADFAGAAAAYRRALALAHRTGETWEEAANLHNLGTLLQAHGRPWEALGTLRAALALWSRQTGLPARDGEAETLTTIGWVYASTGDWPRALDAHLHALRLRNRLPDFPKRAVSLTQIGAIWLQIEPHRALPYFERARALQKKGASPGDQAATLNGLAVALRRLGRAAEAQAAYRQALALYSTPPDPGGQAITWTNLGWTSLSLRQPDPAFTSFTEALRLARGTHNPMSESRALLGMAEAELARGNPTAAQGRAEESLALVESLRAAVLRPDLRTSYLAANESAYDLLIRILMEQHRRQPGSGYDLQALARSEQERARVLLDALRERRERRSDLAAGVSPALLAQRRTLLAAIGALDLERRKLGASPAEASAAEEKLAERLERLSDLDAEIRRRRLPASPSPRPPASLAEQRRRLLDRDTVLLEYSLGSPQSHLWLVATDAVQSFELPDRHILEPLLRSAYEAITAGPAPGSASLVPVAGLPSSDPLLTLSRHLLGPVARQLAGKRLLIAADGALHSIPFAALPAPDGRHEPLVLRNEIVSVPSLAVLGELRDRRTGRAPAPLPLALLADPVFDASDERLAAAARSAPRPEPQDLFLPRLPSSRDEAEAIAALLPAGQAFQALDFAASRDLVLSGRLAPYGTLHIATHGLLRLDHPELSALVLSRFDRDGTPRDGYLRIPDLESLTLSADLVVLSACNTALGRETPGEGLVGLPQAFFTAGASRVLVSLWPVDDAATAALMKEFYRRLLRDRLPPGRALREAQLALRAQPRWSAPRSWAGFVLQGDWR